MLLCIDDLHHDDRHPKPRVAALPIGSRGSDCGLNESAASMGRGWRSRFGGLAVVMGAVTLLVVVGLAVGEAAGWPFLADPLQRVLSDKLARRVSFTPISIPTPSTDSASSGRSTQPTPAGASGSTPFAIRFLGGVRLQTPHLFIAAPAWSATPHLLTSRDVALDLRYTDLWRAYRGEPIRIERLHAATLDANLERLADGRASWQFGPPKRLTLPQFGSLQVADGRLHYRDVPLAASVEARMTLAEASAVTSAAVPQSPASAVATAAPRAASGLQLSASGQYRQLPLKLELASSGVLPLAAEGPAATAVPVSLNITVGRANLAFNGSATDALNFGGLRGRFVVKGPSLAAVGDPIGVTLPTTSAFRTDGRLVKQGDTWQVLIDDATVGASRLNGAFTYDGGGSVPVLSGRLGGSRLLLADLGPVVGTTAAVPASTPASSAAMPLPNANTAKAKGRVLPDRPFDLAALRAMDANVLIDISDVDLNTKLLEPLRPLHVHLQLKAGVLTLNDLDARTADGRLQGALALDGRGSKALWDTQLRWSGVRLERWVRQTRTDGSPPFVSGRLNGNASLKGEGRSTAEILASLRGRTHSELRNGSVSHLVVEAAGIDIAQALGVMLKGDDALPVQCAVADMVVEGGVFRPRPIVLDTTDSTVWIDGSLSLATEALDLRAVVSPKDFSPLTLRTPLRVRGSFADPVVSLDKAPLGRKLGAALLLGLINPVAALIPLIDPGDAQAAQRGAASCPGMTQRGSAKPAAVASRTNRPLK